MEKTIQTVRLGDIHVGGFVESHFALDGGAMFGVVPKVMWQKLLKPDEENRVPMLANLFYVKIGDYQLLLDTGLGDALSDFDKKVYAPRGESNIGPALNALGSSPEQITHVVFTHLHTDHSNGAFVGNPDDPDLRFPNAKHVVQTDEWDDAVNPNERTGAVYLVPRLKKIEENGQLELVDGDVEIVPGVTVRKTGGHTRGHQGVEVRSGNERFVYYADIIPTRFHLKGPYVAAVDLFPLDTMKFKRAFLKDCCDNRTIVGFDHDTEVMFGRLVQKEKWMDVVPVDTVTVPA